MIRIARTCPFCNTTYALELPEDEYRIGMERYRNGALIQDAFPTFTPSQREAIMTGICDDCWDNM